MRGMMDCSERRGALGRARGAVSSRAQQREGQSTVGWSQQWVGGSRGAVSHSEDVRRLCPVWSCCQHGHQTKRMEVWAPALVRPVPQAWGRERWGRVMGASRKQARVIHGCLKKTVQEGPGQVLTSSGSPVSLEDESSWMCLAMPFSSCQGEMHGGTRDLPSAPSSSRPGPPCLHPRSTVGSRAPSVKPPHFGPQ